MAKYKVDYTEIFRKSFIVEAESEEEAQEKMEYAAENIPIDMDDCFDHWEVGAAREPKKVELDYCDLLPEKE